MLTVNSCDYVHVICVHCLQGNCADPPSQSPAVAQLTLNEEVPPNACVIEVEEDFMELPVREGRGATELWLDNFYIVTHTPRITPNASATTILHKDGDLYITNTVFQGRNYWNRAIDLSSADGGSPLLYVGGMPTYLGPEISVFLDCSLLCCPVKAASCHHGCRVRAQLCFAVCLSRFMLSFALSHLVTQDCCCNCAPL